MKASNVAIGPRRYLIRLDGYTAKSESGSKFLTPDLTDYSDPIDPGVRARDGAVMIATDD